MRSDNSPLTVAFHDPILRDEGLASDRLGDASSFFELTEGQAHRLLCSCMNGWSMLAGTTARRIHRIANPNIRLRVAARLHEGGDVQPLVAVVTKCDGPLTLGGPHPPDDRLQANAVLVRGPDLNRLARVLRPLLGDDRGQLFLNASRSSGVAEAGWRGRGFCTDQPIAFRASQPR